MTDDQSASQSDTGQQILVDRSGPTAAVPLPVVPTICTVATRADLPAVRVLESSFLAHHADSRFVALIVDAEPGHAERGVLTPHDIGLSEEELGQLATACTASQLCAVLRPRLLEWLLITERPVLYLDPSVYVLGPITTDVFAGLAHGPLVLLPRVLRPLPDDGLRPTPAELFQAGIYEPGLLAVAPGAEEFVRSWAEQARRVPSAADNFLDVAPALVAHHLLRHTCFGLSYWNIAQRELFRDADGRLTLFGEPLRTVHFTGFDPRRPWLLTAQITDRPRVLLSEYPLVAELCAAYRAALVEAGHSLQEVNYRFDRLADGTILPAALRAAYHDECVAAERADQPAPPSAFSPAGPAGFLDWACQPDPDLPGSTRWAAAVWRDDATLRREYPDPFGADFAGFRDWCAGPGVATARLPIAAVPGVRANDEALRDQLGVSVLGDGPVADLMRAAAQASGLPTSTGPAYPVVLRCAPGTPAPADRYLISVALDATRSTDPEAPLDAAAGADLADLAGANEIWVPSESSSAGLPRADPPVRVFPLPVPDDGARTDEARRAARALLDLPERAEAVVFACVAEYSTDYSRERAVNALGAVSAFLTAFADRSDVVLVVAVSGVRAHPEAAERLRLGTVADQRIILIEDPSPEVGQAVLDAADCMVSLHRTAGSEHAAMALARYAMRGVPVLASGHGAVAEMFDASSALLVPCHAGGTEPDVRAAALLMRGVADDLGGADQVGLAGRQHLLDTRAVSRVGAALRERVEQAYRGWRARRAVSRPNQVPDPLHAMHAARHALLRRPDVGVASRTPMAPALRKAVLRVLSHYDNHMRDVLTTLVDSVERTAEELLRRQDDVRDGVGIGELDQLRAQLEQLVERQDQLDDQLVGIDDGVIRVRADLAGQGRRMREVEDAVVGEAAKRAKQVDTLAERIDRLTTALDRTLDRIDGLESQLVDVLRERDSRLDSGVRAATQALQTADALRRVVVREHERHSPPVDGVRSSLVLSDAGLLRLPAEDSVMLPLLSSNGVWEPELSELIDSLVEPDGIFLDVGAYVGYHTIRMLSRLGTSGAVVAVEPSAPAALLLRHNVEVNVSAAIARRLVVFEAAAWDSPGQLLVEPALTGGVAVHPPTDDHLTTSPEPTTQTTQIPESNPNPTEPPVAPESPEEPEPTTVVPTVTAIRLDRELENLASTRDLRLSVVRIDVPGRGHRALAGLVRLLRRDRPHVLLEFAASATESFGDDPITVLREFRTWGYDLVPLSARRPVTPEEVMELVGPSRSTTLWLHPRTKSPSAAPPSDLVQAADQAI